MLSIRHIARLSAAVLALSLASVATAPAQSTVPSANRGSIRAPYPPAVDRALREFGFEPYRLRPDQQRAIDSAWGLLFPEMNRYRSNLNSSQATALVYMALVHGRGGRDGRGGGWNNGNNGGGRWDDDRDDYGRDNNGRDNDGRGGYGNNDDRYGRGQCVDINRRVYDLENALSTGTRSLFLDDAQKRAVRESARDVQRMAVDRGLRRAADRAGEVIEEVSENLPERTEVRARVQALKSAVDESCGGREDRRY